MLTSFPVVCKTSQADEFLLKQINKLEKALEERDMEIHRLQQQVTRLSTRTEGSFAIDGN